MEFGDIKIFMINRYITFLSFATETCIQGVNVKHLKTKLVSECHIMSLNVKVKTLKITVQQPHSISLISLLNHPL